MGIAESECGGNCLCDITGARVSDLVRARNFAAFVFVIIDVLLINSLN